MILISDHMTGSTPTRADLLTAQEAALLTPEKVVDLESMVIEIDQPTFIKPEMCWMNGVLQRQVVHPVRLTQPVTAGAMEVHVADSSSFQVDHYILPFKDIGQFPATFYDGDEYNALKITEIDGNRLVLRAPIKKDYAVDDYVIQHYDMIWMRDNTRLQDIVIDGQRDAGTYYSSWASNTAVLMSGTGTALINSTFVNLVGDCLRTGNAQNLTVSGCVMQDLNGSALHLSGVAGMLIEDNRIINIGKYWQEQRHTEAAITWSQATSNVTVRGNTISGCPNNAISADLNTNTDLTFENNFATDYEKQFLRLTKTNMIPKNTKITIRGNCYDGPGVELIGLSAGQVFVE